MSVKFNDFVNDYYDRFSEAVLGFDKAMLDPILSVFDTVTEAGGTIWMAGNGGSAGIADHSVCDIAKGTYVAGHKPVRAISLSANGPLMTALGNDISYDDIYAEQLKYYLTDKDAVLFVSSSGNSENVVRACAFAKEKGVPTMAFTGFEGGRLKDMADHVVHIPVKNYGIVEDIHQSVIHVLTQYLAARKAS